MLGVRVTHTSKLIRQRRGGRAHFRHCARAFTHFATDANTGIHTHTHTCAHFWEASDGKLGIAVLHPQQRRPSKRMLSSDTCSNGARQGIKAIYTIRNINRQGVLPFSCLSVCGLVNEVIWRREEGGDVMSSRTLVQKATTHCKNRRAVCERKRWVGPGGGRESDVGDDWAEVRKGGKLKNSWHPLLGY